ncbi:protein of unknown function [Paraburkholderia kururiensis]
MRPYSYQAVLPEKCMQLRGNPVASCPVV